MIGIDVATDWAKTGVAHGWASSDAQHLVSARTCARNEDPALFVAELARAAPGACLLAFDAPLGWPVDLGATLSTHVAGAALNAEADLLFRRETDRFVATTYGKTPLDVGADKIARTAHAALELLDRVRNHVGADIPLRWQIDGGDRLTAIEVYPAVTLLARGWPCAKYKKPDQAAEREAIARHLRDDMRTSRDVVFDNADALDAAVCVLAGFDFLANRAHRPSDISLAEREGWIWVRRREEPRA